MSPPTLSSCRCSSPSTISWSLSLRTHEHGLCGSAAPDTHRLVVVGRGRWWPPGSSLLICPALALQDGKPRCPDQLLLLFLLRLLRSSLRDHHVVLDLAAPRRSRLLQELLHRSHPPARESELLVQLPAAPLTKPFLSLPARCTLRPGCSLLDQYGPSLSSKDQPGPGLGHPLWDASTSDAACHEPHPLDILDSPYGRAHARSSSAPPTWWHGHVPPSSDFDTLRWLSPSSDQASTEQAVSNLRILHWVDLWRDFPPTCPASISRFVPRPVGFTASPP